MLRFDSSPGRRTSYQFTIRRNPAGSWLAEESHGSLGASLSAARQPCASHCVKRTEMPIGSISNRLRRFWSTSRRSPASLRSMQLSLTFRYDGDGWLIRGLPRDPVGRFDDLAEARLRQARMRRRTGKHRVVRRRPLHCHGGSGTGMASSAVPPDGIGSRDTGRIRRPEARVEDPPDCRSGMARCLFYGELAAPASRGPAR
jgi:hypothetical protein